MAAEKREFGVTEREIVSTLLDTGGVNFEAIGKALATYGGDIARYGFDGDDIVFCGTNRIFVRVFHLQGGVSSVGDLRALGELSREVRG